MSESILFITGKLAERQLARILEAMKPEFGYKINQIGVSVAALMSENLIMRRVTKNQKMTKIIVPGRFRGDLNKLTNFFNVPVERGPEDLRHLPDYFGMEGFKDNLEDHSCLIFAEIVDATVLSVNQILSIAERYKQDGADIIDLGCMPDTTFDHLEETIFKLKKIGMKVSVDSADSNELIRGGKVGADYLLSISEKNIFITDHVSSIPVLIPSKPGNLRSLERIINIFLEKKKKFLADPILDPIHYGFSESLDRFRRIRKKFPNIDLLMGIGNLTELTDCDSNGVNTILMGLVSELDVRAVLAVQVSNHCRNSIKEADSARKLMHFAKKNQRLPIGINKDLYCMADKKPIRLSSEDISHIRSLIKDKNYRILISEDGINIFNSDIYKKGIDPFDFFDDLNLENDSSHAFYLGVELARAQIAFQLGKNYNQDNELGWGISVKKNQESLLKRPKLKTTQKKK